MITEPTVLVLGAGASVEYGFPTGRQLLLNICRDVGPQGGIYNFFKDHLEISPSGMERFVDALKKSSSPSVDFFLENRREFEEIGKMAIAASLIPHEKYEAFTPAAVPRWYEILFHLMAEGGRFEENRLSVITFNYDRSLEAFLFQVLQNLYGLASEEAEQRLRKIPIIHLYGTLGTKLTWGGPERGYDPNLKGNWIAAAAKSIKIVHQAKPTTDEFQRAHNLLRGASEIIFLGFGFHRINVERLSLEENIEFNLSVTGREPRLLACRTGIGHGTIARIQKYMPDTIQFAPDEKWNICEFLANTECLNTYDKTN